MASKHMVIVTLSEEGKGAYGITKDTDENMYIPVKMAEALGLEEFEEVEVIAVKNDRAEPPLRAIRARRPNDDDLP